MMLKCKECGAPMKREDIDLDTGLAKCSHCGSLYGLDSAVPKIRPRVPLPEKFKVDSTSRSLNIAWRWFRPSLFGLLFFCIAWNGFLVFWYMKAGSAYGAGWIGILFPIGHVAVGIGLTYSVITGFLNSTRISVDKRALKVRHGPLPLLSGVTLTSAELDQIYCKELKKSSKDSQILVYEVNAVLKDGGSRKLIKGLAELEQALWLEQEIETFLGIRDRPVGGEVPKAV